MQLVCGGFIFVAAGNCNWSPAYRNTQVAGEDSNDPSDAYRMLSAASIDRDVLEAVLALTTDDAKSLPVGLRVTVKFLSSRLPKQ